MNAKLNYVDALRGIAILMVILVHTAQQVPSLNFVVKGLAEYAQMGVQLFFVASAYTLCLSFEKRSGESHALRAFYIRRFFRIAPLYYLAIAIYFTLLIAKQLVRTGQISETAPYSVLNVAANFLFLHGFIPSANNSIVPGGWSIGTEMAFYLCFPLLYRIAKNLSSKSIAPLIALLGICFAADIALQMAIQSTTSYAINNNDFLYFNFTNQLPVFIAGIIAYFLNSRMLHQQFLSSKLMTGSVFLIFSAIALYFWESNPPFAFAVIPTLSAISFLFLLNFVKSAKRQSAILCRVGTVSFSMYVFHFLFVLGLAPVVVRRLSTTMPPSLMLVLVFALCTLLTFCVARLTERAIEAKGISVGAHLIGRLRAQAIEKTKIPA